MKVKKAPVVKPIELNTKFLTEFAAINKKRSNELYDTLQVCKTADLVVSLCEEVGEIAGFVKKAQRDKKNYRKEIGKEIADVFMYLDLLCTLDGYDFGQLIVDKFNEVSRRKNSQIKIKRVK